MRRLGKFRFQERLASVAYPTFTPARIPWPSLLTNPTHTPVFRMSNATAAFRPIATTQ